MAHDDHPPLGWSLGGRSSRTTLGGAVRRRGADVTEALFPALTDVAVLRERPTEGVPPSRVFEATDRTFVFEVSARALSRVGAGRPLVLVLEDLHDVRASVEALQSIVPRIGATPTFVAGTFASRDVERGHPWGARFPSTPGHAGFRE